MTLDRAMKMIKPFKGLPYYEVAVTELRKAAGLGKRELRRVAYRIRDAFAEYEYAVNYGKPE